jgi:adenylate cyclase
MATRIEVRHDENATSAGGFSDLNAGFRLSDWAVDPVSNSLSRDGETIRLEPKVMEVLVYLASRPGVVVSRGQLEDDVWNGLALSYDTVTGAIGKLRKALDDDARAPRLIETVSKKGYRLLVPALPPGPDDPMAASATIDASAGSRPVMRVAMVVALLAILFAGTTIAWLKFSGPSPVAPTDAPTIAVLPFKNLSADAAMGYFADGITDDLITGLARSTELLVISRDSTFYYKDHDASNRALAEGLNADFAVRGSVRRSGEDLRVNVRVVDLADDKHLWAGTYDGKLDDLPGLEAGIIQQIIAALPNTPKTGDLKDFGLVRTSSPQARDSFLIGRQRFYLYLDKSENRAAREYFEKALELDDHFAMAYAMLAWTHAFDAMNGWSENRERSLDLAWTLADKATTLDNALPVAYFVKGLALREQGEYVKALAEAEHALALDGNYANAHVLVATLLYYAGAPEEGLARIRMAMRLHPHHPYNYAFHLGQALYILGRYGEAIDALKSAITSNPASERLHVWLAASYAQSGRTEEARWEADEIRALNPDFSLAAMRAAFPFKDPADSEHFLAGLRKAGLSDHAEN